MRAALAAAVVLGTLLPDAARAQRLVVRGTVLDGATRQPISQASVILLDSLRAELTRTTTDSAGLFYIARAEPGTFMLRAEHIGYAAVTTAAFGLQRGEELQVELLMGVEAIALDPLIVVARRQERFGRLSEYYDRLDRGRRFGMGHFITRADIEDSIALEATDLFRLIPGVRVAGQNRELLMTRAAGGCVPAVYVDGMMLNRDMRAFVNDYVAPDMIEGIEVYRGAAQSPVQYENRGGCGTVLIWTRMGDPSGKPFSWWRLAAGSALLLGLMLLAR